ncbi:MAG: Txe/YoeB family addiction module toxin [Candidatus Hydrogenedentes bacterium]|nr:Txe/YoeB family addiction module toxin [Candidatus Hydrogenedentota bacterium]
MTWRIIFSKQAQKDARKIASSGLEKNAAALVEILRNDPFQYPPPYEKLIGDFSSAYSRRINIQHRLVYRVIASEHTVHVLRMWTHYE